MKRIIPIILISIFLLCPCAYAAYTQMTDYTAYFFEGDLYITNNSAELEIGHISVFPPSGNFYTDEPIEYIIDDGLSINIGETKLIEAYDTFKRIADKLSLPSIKVRIEPHERIKGNLKHFCNSPELFFDYVASRQENAG